MPDARPPSRSRARPGAPPADHHNDIPAPRLDDDDLRYWFNEFIRKAVNDLRSVKRAANDDDIWLHISAALDHVNAAYDIVHARRRNDGR